VAEIGCFVSNREGTVYSIVEFGVVGVTEDCV